MLNQMVVSEVVNWVIVKELVYEEVLIISDFESTLAKIVSVGNNPHAFDFAVKFVRNFVISLEKIALQDIPNLMNVLQHSQDRENSGIKRLLMDIRMLNSIKNQNLSDIKQNIENQFLEWLNLTSKEPYLNSKTIEEYLRKHEGKSYMYGQK